MPQAAGVSAKVSFSIFGALAPNAAITHFARVRFQLGDPLLELLERSINVAFDRSKAGVKGRLQARFSHATPVFQIRKFVRLLGRIIQIGAPIGHLRHIGFLCRKRRRCQIVFPLSANTRILCRKLALCFHAKPAASCREPEIIEQISHR